MSTNRVIKTPHDTLDRTMGHRGIRPRSPRAPHPARAPASPGGIQRLPPSTLEGGACPTACVCLGLRDAPLRLRSSSPSRAARVLRTLPA